jgi:hypothetical protein
MQDHDSPAREDRRGGASDAGQSLHEGFVLLHGVLASPGALWREASSAIALKHTEIGKRGQPLACKVRVFCENRAISARMGEMRRAVCNLFRVMMVWVGRRCKQE